MAEQSLEKEAGGLEDEDEDEGEDEEDLSGLADLFKFAVDDYSTRTFTFGTLKQELLCLNRASTGLEDTGQIVWPVSVLTSWWLVSNQKLLKDKILVEVGSGCGLCGLVASQFCRASIMTDNNEQILDVLSKNADNQASKEAGGDSHRRIYHSELTWGASESISALQGGLLEKLCPGSAMVDIVIGADVFHRSFGDPRFLFDTIKQLFAGSKVPQESQTGLFVCGFTDRGRDWAEWSKEVLEAATEYGFQRVEVDPSTFLPRGLLLEDIIKSTNGGLYGRNPMHLYLFSLPAARSSVTAATSVNNEQ